MGSGDVERLGLWFYDKIASKDIQPIVTCEPRLCHDKETYNRHFIIGDI